MRLAVVRARALLAIQALLRRDEDRARFWLRQLHRDEHDAFQRVCERLVVLSEETRR